MFTSQGVAIHYVAVGAFFPTGARTEHPKLFGFVLPCDSVDFITLRNYLVHHAHFENIDAFPTENKISLPQTPARGKAGGGFLK